MRRTRSANGRSRKTISAETAASRKPAHFCRPPSIRTGPPGSHRLGRGQRDRQRGAGVLAGPTGAGVPVADGVDERGQLGGVGVGQQLLVAADGLDQPAGRAGEHHAGAAAVAHGGHAAGAEHLAAHVVAVGGLEARLGDRRRRRCRSAPTTTAVSSSPRSRHSGSTSASAVAYTSTASAPGFRNRSVSKSWIRVSLKIVSGGDPGRVEAARVAGHRAQQPRGAQPAVVEQRAGRRPVRRRTAG